VLVGAAAGIHQRLTDKPTLATRKRPRPELGAFDALAPLHLGGIWHGPIEDGAHSIERLVAVEQRCRR
jgi:hypothetical protein